MTQKICNDALESRWSCLKDEHHGHCKAYVPVHAKISLLLTLLDHSHLIIPTKIVHEATCLMTHNGVYTVYEAKLSQIVAAFNIL